MEKKKYQQKNIKIDFFKKNSKSFDKKNPYQGQKTPIRQLDLTIFLNQSGIISNRNMPWSFCIKNPKENIFF